MDNKPARDDDESNPFMLPIAVIVVGGVLQWLVDPRSEGSSWGLFENAGWIIGGAMLLAVGVRELAGSLARLRDRTDD